jgi:hypothetical protein
LVEILDKLEIENNLQERRDLALVIAEDFPRFRGLAGEIYLVKQDIKTMSMIEHYYASLESKYCDASAVAEGLKRDLNRDPSIIV